MSVIDVLTLPIALGIVIGYPLLCGYAASRLMKRKNRHPGGGWALGVFLGVVGIIAAGLIRTQPPEALQTVQCPRCHAHQQVPDWVTELDCDRCEHQIPLKSYDVGPEEI